MASSVRVTLNDPLPSSGSSLITAVEYRLNGGTAVDSGLIAFTPLPLTFVIPEADTANIEIRQKNATLYSNWSGIKNAFELVLTGLDNGKAVIGTEPTISFVWSPTEGAPTLIEQYWSLNNLANGAEETFGFGVNPTSLAGADNQPLWLIAQDSAGAYYEVSTTIKQQAPVVVGPLPAQVLTEDTGSYTIDGSLYLTGGGITYSVPNAPTGVSVDALSGLITVNANETGVVVGGTITLSGISSGGGPFTTAGTLDVSANAGIVAIVEPVASTLWDEDLLSALDNIDTFEDPANYTSAGTATVVSIFRSGPDLTLANRDELLLEGEAWEITFRVTDSPSGDIRDYIVSGTTQKLWSLTSIGTNEISVVVEAGVPANKVMPKISQYEHSFTADNFRNGPVGVGGVSISGDLPVGNLITGVVNLVTVPDGRTLTTTYQWTDDQGNISGATDITYTTTAGQAGETLNLVATLDDGVASTVDVTSNGLVIGAAGYTQLLYDNQATAHADIAVSGDTASPLMTLSMWIKIPVLPVSGNVKIWENTNTKSFIYVNTSGTLRLILLDSGDVEVWDVQSAAGAVVADTWYHLGMNVDLTSGSVVGNFELDGVDIINTTGTTLVTGTGLVRQGGQMRFFTNNAKSPILDAHFADLWFSYGEFIALSTFYNAGTPPDISAVGAPDLFWGDELTAVQITSGSNNGSKTTTVTGTFIAGT